MVPLSILAPRWALRLVALAVSVVVCAGFAASLPPVANTWGALVGGALFGFAGWWCALFGPPEWADGQAAGSE